MIKQNLPHHRHLSLPVLAVCVLFSLLGHGLAGIILERFGPHQFGTAISEPAVVMVDLASQPPAGPSPPSTVKSPQTGSPLVIPQLDTLATPPAVTPPQPLLEQPVQQLAQTVAPAPPVYHDQQHRYLQGDQIFPHQQEKLVYQISLTGMPVGHARLEASNHQGELRIRSSVSSNSAISAFYPVNNSTDTRLIKGRYLLTRIRQQEGPFVSDTGFNLMYPEQKIFWVDRIKNQFSNEPLESLDTLDFVSGFYFLRLQPLKVGDQLTLRLYDGDTTTLVPVRVLRQEKLRLSGLRSAATVVVQPHFAQSGFFRSNRDLLVWFSDDQHHVPVKIEASTPIGRVVAELVSSERTLVALPQGPSTAIVPSSEIQYK